MSESPLPKLSPRQALGEALPAIRRAAQLCRVAEAPQPAEVLESVARWVCRLAGVPPPAGPEAHPPEVVAELEACQQRLGRIHTAVGMREGESVEVAATHTAEERDALLLAARPLAALLREALARVPVLGDVLTVAVPRADADALVQATSGPVPPHGVEDVSFAEGGAYMLAKVLECLDVDAALVGPAPLEEVYPVMRERLASLEVLRTGAGVRRLLSHERLAPGVALAMRLTVANWLDAKLQEAPLNEGVFPAERRSLVREVEGMSVSAGVDTEADFVSPRRVQVALALLDMVNPETDEAAAALEDARLLLNPHTPPEEVLVVLRKRGPALKPQLEGSQS